MIVIPSAKAFEPPKETEADSAAKDISETTESGDQEMAENAMVNPSEDEARNDEEVQSSQIEQISE